MGNSNIDFKKFRYEEGFLSVCWLANKILLEYLNSKTNQLNDKRMIFKLQVSVCDLTHHG